MDGSYDKSTFPAAACRIIRAPTFFPKRLIKNILPPVGLRCDAAIAADVIARVGRAVVTAVWNAKRCAIAEGYVIMVSDAANELSEMRSPRRGS